MIPIKNCSPKSDEYTEWNASFHNGDTTQLWITYNSSAKNLFVFWNYNRTSNSDKKTSLSYIVDLREALPERFQIGFSAAIGDSGQQHRLFPWELNSDLDIKVSAITHFLNTSEKDSKNSSKMSRIIIGIFVPLCAIVAGGIVQSLVFLRRRKQIRMREQDENMNVKSFDEDFERGAGPRRFSYKYLAIATSRFSSDRKLGEGGFVAVYKAYLKEIERLMIVGLLCTPSDPSFRPSIRQAIQVLNFESPIPNIPDRIPVPTCHDVQVPVQPIISSKEPSLTFTSIEVGR